MNLITFDKLKQQNTHPMAQMLYNGDGYLTQKEINDAVLSMRLAGYPRSITTFLQRNIPQVLKTTIAAYVLQTSASSEQINYLVNCIDSSVTLEHNLDLLKKNISLLASGFTPEILRQVSDLPFHELDSNPENDFYNTARLMPQTISQSQFITWIEGLLQAPESSRSWILALDSDTQAQLVALPPQIQQEIYLAIQQNVTHDVHGNEAPASVADIKNNILALKYAEEFSAKDRMPYIRGIINSAEGRIPYIRGIVNVGAVLSQSGPDWDGRKSDFHAIVNQHRLSFSSLAQISKQILSLPDKYTDIKMDLLKFALDYDQNAALPLSDKMLTFLAEQCYKDPTFLTEQYHKNPAFMVEQHHKDPEQINHISAPAHFLQLIGRNIITEVNINASHMDILEPFFKTFTDEEFKRRAGRPRFLVENNEGPRNLLRIYTAALNFASPKDRKDLAEILCAPDILKDAVNSDLINNLSVQDCKELATFFVQLYQNNALSTNQAKPFAMLECAIMEYQASKQEMQVLDTAVSHVKQFATLYNDSSHRRNSLPVDILKEQYFEAIKNNNIPTILGVQYILHRADEPATQDVISSLLEIFNIQQWTLHNDNTSPVMETGRNLWITAMLALYQYPERCEAIRNNYGELCEEIKNNAHKQSQGNLFTVPFARLREQRYKHLLQGACDQIVKDTEGLVLNNAIKSELSKETSQQIQQAQENTMDATGANKPDPTPIQLGLANVTLADQFDMIAQELPADHPAIDELQKLASIYRNAEVQIARAEKFHHKEFGDKLQQFIQDYLKSDEMNTHLNMLHDDKLVATAEEYLQHCAVLFNDTVVEVSQELTDEIESDSRIQQRQIANDIHMDELTWNRKQGVQKKYQKIGTTPVSTSEIPITTGNSGMPITAGKTYTEQVFDKWISKINTAFVQYRQAQLDMSNPFMPSLESFSTSETMRTEALEQVIQVNRELQSYQGDLDMPAFQRLYSGLSNDHLSFLEEAKRFSMQRMHNEEHTHNEEQMH